MTLRINSLIVASMLIVGLSLLQSGVGVFSIPITSRTIPAMGTIETVVIVFESGFEAGDLSDVQVLQAWGGRVDIAVEPVNQGDYSARCRTWPTENNGQGRARVAPRPDGVVPNLDQGHIEAQFNIKSWEGYIEILEFSGHLNDGTYVFICWITITDNTIRLRYLWPEDREVVVVQNFQTGRWYRIGLRFKIGRGDGYYRAYIDGRRVISVEGLDNTVASEDTSQARAGTPTPRADRAWAGIVLCYSGGRYFELYVDDLMVTTTQESRYP